MGFTDLNNGGQPTGSGYGPVPTPIYRYLDTNGDGTGTKNAIGNYTGEDGTLEIPAEGVTSFFIQPAPGEIFRIQRMIVNVHDAQKFKPEEYGNLTALTNGIFVRVSNNGTTLDLTDGVPVKTNGSWGALCFDAELYSAAAGNGDYLRVRWTFAASGYPIRLVGDNNDRLEVVLNDNFTGLLDHYFQVQGYIEGTA